MRDEEAVVSIAAELIRALLARNPAIEAVVR
jgi:hypothetical protein